MLPCMFVLHVVFKTLNEENICTLPLENGKLNDSSHRLRMLGIRTSVQLKCAAICSTDSLTLAKLQSLSISSSVSPSVTGAWDHFAHVWVSRKIDKQRS